MASGLTYGQINGDKPMQSSFKTNECNYTLNQRYANHALTYFQAFKVSLTLSCIFHLLCYLKAIAQL